MRKIVFSLFGVVLVAAIVPAQDTKPAAGGVTVDKEKRTVTVAAKVAPRKLPNLEQVYPVELIAGWGAPKGKKAHEIIVSVDINPSEVHKGLVDLGLKPGKAAKGENAKAEGPEVKVWLEVPGMEKKISLDKALMDPKSKKPAPKMTFRFTGSVMSATDPNKPDDKKYGADLTGTLIALFPVTDECVLQTDWTMKEEKYLKLDVNPDVLPKEGSPIRIVIEAPKP